MLMDLPKAQSSMKCKWLSDENQIMVDVLLLELVWLQKQGTDFDET